jgi:hypothetical protein
MQKLASNKLQTGHSTHTTIKLMAASSRSGCGQAIIESTIGLVVIVMLGVGLIALGLNTYWVVSNQAKANVVAQESARSIGADLYWLNCVRRADFNIDTAREKAGNMANVLSSQIGLAQPSEVAVDEEPLPNHQGSVLRVKLKFPPFALPFNLGGIFPSFSKVEGIGVVSAGITRPYLTMHYNATGVGEGPGAIRRTSIVPALGFMNNSGPNDENNSNMENMPAFIGQDSAITTPCAMIGYSGDSEERAHIEYFNPGGLH